MPPIGSKPHHNVWIRGSYWVLEDTEMMTYTLYDVVDTMMNPSQGAVDLEEDKPYYYDALRGVMYVLREVGTEPDTDAGLEELTSLVAPL